MIKSLNDACINKVWNDWISNESFSSFQSGYMGIKRLRFEVVNGNNVVKEEYISAEKLIEEGLIRQATSVWKHDLDRDKAKIGEGGNKLRTYAKFKKQLGVEPYLIHVHDDRKRALLFKFRAGVAPLRIETGRYEAARPKQRGVPVYERICMCCCKEVEDEEHFLCSCPAYAVERDALLGDCKIFNDRLGVDEDKKRLRLDNSGELFIGLMRSDDCSLVNSLANFVWKAFQVREVRLKDLMSK